MALRYLCFEKKFLCGKYTEEAYILTFGSDPLSYSATSWWPQLLILLPSTTQHKYTRQIHYNICLNHPSLPHTNTHTSPTFFSASFLIHNLSSLNCSHWSYFFSPCFLCCFSKGGLGTGFGLSSLLPTLFSIGILLRLLRPPGLALLPPIFVLQCIDQLPALVRLIARFGLWVEVVVCRRKMVNEPPILQVRSL